MSDDYSEHLLEMIEANDNLSQWLGGLRKSLIAQGFSEHTAEVLVIITYQRANQP